MSSPGSRKSQCQTIPAQRIFINDPSQIPCDYSTTPGGTFYSTTPGGSRIVYDRSQLMNLRNSPLSKTPPNIPDLPESMYKKDSVIKNNVRNGKPIKFRASPLKKSPMAEDRNEQFEIDI